MTENWKPLLGKYLISDQGRVMNTKTARILKPCRSGRAGNQYHAVCLRNNGIAQTLLVHKLVAEAFIPNPQNKRCVDHIDGDAFNNRLENLRWATHAENQANRKPNRNKTSRFKGVSLYGDKWLVHIGFNGVSTHVGYYDDEEEAGRAYDDLARQVFGEFARCNFN